MRRRPSSPLAFLAAPLERPLAIGCERWCRLVARHPWPFILLPILSTGLLSSGLFLKFRVVRGVNYLYSALDAPWKAEYQVFMDNWAAQDQRFYPGRDALLRPGLFVIATARDNGSVLRPAHARQLGRLIDWIADEPIEWPPPEEGGGEGGGRRTSFSFRQVCLQFPAGRCFANENARMVAEMFSEEHANPFNVTFPRFRMDAQLVDLSSTLGGVQLVDGTSGRLKSARAWMLIFQLRQNPRHTIGRMSSHFEHSLASRIRQSLAPCPLLQLAHYHSGTFDRELAENAVQLAPKFGATFALLVLFAVLCTFDWLWMPIGGGHSSPSSSSTSSSTSSSSSSSSTSSGWHLPAIDWVRSKPLLGLCGVLSTLMAIASAMGLLLWAGVTFVDMCSVMPFLSLTIGIDDTFLMLAAWRATSPALPVESRVEQAMRHAAVSIAITSLTDALAFLIGSIAPLPAVIYFCYYSSMAILFIFLHFMTIFLAVLTIQGRWEAEGRHCLFRWPTQNAVAHARPSPLPLMSALLNSGRHCPPSFPIGHPLPPPPPPQHWSQQLLASFYAPLIAHWIVQLMAFASLAAYVWLCVNGVKQLTVGFKLIDIISYDQRARQFLLLREEYFAADVRRLELAVMRPPNLGRPSTPPASAFLSALDRLEAVPNCTAGPGEFWWRQWREEAKVAGHGDEFGRMDMDERAFSLAARPFLKANAQFDYDLLRSPFENGDGTAIRAFRLSIQLAHFEEDDQLLRCAREIRAICREHPQFGMSTYSPLWNLADQFEIIWPQTMQDLFISVGVMALVSLLVIPRPFCAAVVAANILSIGFGVIGFMPYWGVNLDATSMITIAMSVGFSVDFAAHITYSYILVAEGHRRGDGKGPMTSKKATPRECLEGALCSVGWPISQATFSVLLGIAPLATVNTHIIQTCFKTVFLVILFGWLHALLYLPLALMNSHRLYNWSAGKWKNGWKNGWKSGGGGGRKMIFVINGIGNNKQ